MRYNVGCDLALQKSCVFIHETISNKIHVILFTSRKKLLKQESHHSFDKKFNIYFYQTQENSMDEKNKIIIDTLVKIKSDIYKLNIEGYSFGSVSASIYQIGEFIGIIKHNLRANNIFYNITPPSQLKKFATGSGTAKKIQLFESIKDSKIKNYINEFALKYKLDPNKDGVSDIVDAYWLSKII